MANRELPSPETLRKLLRYEPETGRLYWLERDGSCFSDGFRTAKHQAALFNSTLAGKEAFSTLHQEGYLRGRVLNKTQAAHRVAWAIYYGTWPVGEIDHINGNPSDNRIENLREVCHQENGRNQKLPVNNSSGVMGVYYNKQTRKWIACISNGGARRHLGSFSEFDEAVAVRKRAERAYGYHENHGRVL